MVLLTAVNTETICSKQGPACPHVSKARQGQRKAEPRPVRVSYGGVLKGRLKGLGTSIEGPNEDIGRLAGTSGDVASSMALLQASECRPYDRDRKVEQDEEMCRLTSIEILQNRIVKKHRKGVD